MVLSNQNRQRACLLGNEVILNSKPNTRSFSHQSVNHKLNEKEGVLTTRYSFMPVYINGVEIGVYAIEEHFEKQLLESKDKREGPILKFDEEGVWEMALNYGGNGWNTIPYMMLLQSYF